MLQIKNISKKFVTGDLTQVALDDVSLNLRNNEFVAILGPSGSGKTTLLNIIGGLDRYDSGDIIINGVSTKKYKDRDWDSYRNHTIGFVFQSYNLIPHQSILSNVEIALTISGIPKKERRERARKALTEVGLGDQLHKRPNQMSGGQMQRVAIARALVNNPDILLADEPTGALDSETSVQVMELLKKVAKDRLVVMVTHNPELAEKYSTRTVRLKDGKIINDTNPFVVDESKLEAPKHKNLGKSSMSFFTALSLSFNNLRTKIARTLLTSFAGSIGIIGIALILSLSTGVNQYITDIQKETMTSYPISISEQTFDLSGLSSLTSQDMGKADDDRDLSKIYTDSSDFKLASEMSTSLTENNLTKFKKYLEDKDNEIWQYIGENGIVYSYNIKYNIYTYDPEGMFVNTDGSTLTANTGSGWGSQMSSMFSSMMQRSNYNNFSEILPGNNGELISKAIYNNYDIVYGKMPSAYDEIVLVVNRNNQLSANTLYQLGYLPTSEYRENIQNINDGNTVEVEERTWSFDDFCGKELYLVPACDNYVKNSDGTFSLLETNSDIESNAKENGLKLKIVGIIRPTEDATTTYINTPFAYTKALTDYLIEYTNDSEIVKAQENSKDVNVLNNLGFAPDGDEAKIADTKTYIATLGVSEKAKLLKDIMKNFGDESTNAYIQNASETDLAKMFDSNIGSADDETLLYIYENYITSGSYDDNMSAFGVVDYDAPSSINIYVDSFENKDEISKQIEKYNETADEKDKITYTDYVGLLMSSITTIIDVISYVLIAFVAVSLVVSSIMIGIITYISVLERTKEIGILRAIGASKANISAVFNAETLIIGLCAGLIGIMLTLLILIPGNALIHYFAGISTINAFLPPVAAFILVALSMILTFIGGLIPSKKAAKKDPVTALRTE